MFPTLYELPGTGTGVHTYGLFILLAFSTAFLMISYRATKTGLHPDRLLVAYVIVAVTGMLGARAMYAVAVEPERILADPTALLSPAGFVYYGGVLGGSVGVFMCAPFLGYDRWKLLDLIAPALAAALGVGRMGCFFAGCCHGGPAPVSESAVNIVPGGTLHGDIWLQPAFPFLTLEFHDGVGRLLHEPLFPTQLWSAAFGIGLGAILFSLWKKRRFDGQLAVAYLILEPIARFLIESFRADHRGYAISWEVSQEVADRFPAGMTAAGSALQDGSQMVQVGLTTSQAIGLALVVVGIVIAAFRWNAGVGPEAPVKGDEEEEWEEDEEAA